MSLPSRDEALSLLHEYVRGEGLRRHAYAVEAAMRAYAARYGEDADLWGLTGLLHDLDYERYPTAEVHPRHGASVLAERGYPEAMIHAVKAHADYMGLPRVSPLDKSLFAVDELSGLVHAVALVRPSRSLDDLEVSSVKRKMKDKAFARGVNRDDILRGARELGVELDEHIRFVIGALRPVAGDLGLETI